MRNKTENTNLNKQITDEKDYLKNLLKNVKFAFENNQEMTFKIVEPKEKGFVIKVGGLFGYLSYYHMPWKYSSLQYWQSVSDFLIDQVFTCKIHSLEENPISIFIDAKEQKFKTPKLTLLKKYHGVILNKSKYGFFVDIGLHFNWKFGSLLGLVHKSNLIDKIEYENATIGNEVKIMFQGYNQENQLILGNNQERGKWNTSAMNKLVGTIQSVSVVINENDHHEFYVQGEHKAKIPILKKYYPNSRTTAKKYIYGLKDGQTIDCEVIRVNKKKNGFVLRLLIESQTV